MEKRFQAIDDLICQVETKAANEPDTLAILVSLIKVFVRSEADPYLLTGVLIAGVANTFHSRIPDERKRQVAVEALRLLHEHLQAGGAI